MTVIGCGYLGRPRRLHGRELGHDVLGVDVDAAKTAALAAGETPFFEPGLDDVLRRNIAAGRLRFTTDTAEAARLTRPLPLRRDAAATDVGGGRPHRAAHRGPGIGRALARAPLGRRKVDGSGRHVRRARRRDRRADPRRRRRTRLEPGFLREGFAVDDTLHPDRIVVGTRQCPAAMPRRRLPRSTRVILDEPTPYLTMDRATAELVKVSANAFLATKISFINAISEMCEATGPTSRRWPMRSVTIRASGAGSSTPDSDLAGLPTKDIAPSPRAPTTWGRVVLGLLREVDEINMRRRDAPVALVERACDGSVLGRNIAVLGAAFKPESDDVRDSPALAVAARLSLSRARVSVFDPRRCTTRHARSRLCATPSRRPPPRAAPRSSSSPPNGPSSSTCRRSNCRIWSHGGSSSTPGAAWTAQPGLMPAGTTAYWALPIGPGPYIRTGAAFGRG